MKIALIIAAVVAALWAIDRCACAMERRGWIYWRKRKASPGTRAGAFLEIQSLIEPGSKQIVNAQSRDEEQKETDGASPDAGEV